MPYPEHEKMRRVKGDTEVIGDFIEWLQNTKGVMFGTPFQNIPHLDYHKMESMNTEQILAAYFNIDLKIIEKEKDQMLEELRAANNQKENTNEQKISHG